MIQRKTDKSSGLVLTYIELFAMVFLTLAPFPKGVKLVVFFALLFFNVKYIVSARYPTIIGLLVIIGLLASIIDIVNVRAGSFPTLSGLSYLSSFVLCGAFFSKYQYGFFCEKLENILFALCIFSLFGFFLTIAVPSVVFQFPTVSYYNRTVHTVVLYNAIGDEWSGGLLSRNCGVAWEPGAFQLVANLGLALLLRQRKEHFAARFAVYTATVLSTQSTAGLVIFAVLLLIVFVSANYSRRHKFYVLVVTLALAIPLISAIGMQVEKQSTGGGAESRFANSLYVVDNYLLQAEDIGDVLFGIGSNGYKSEYEHNKQIGSWDLYTNLYLRFGAVFMILFLVCMFRIARMDRCVFAVISLSLLSEAVLGPLTVAFFYYSEANRSSLQGFEGKRSHLNEKE